MLERVKDPLPNPQRCDNCASLDISFVGNETIYGKPFGKWPFVWLCYSCEAIVGCHAGTQIPLGRMADKRTRQLRMQAHSVFDPLWKSGAMTRYEAYDFLAKLLNIQRKDCHISRMSKNQLRHVIVECNTIELDKTANIIKRRKEKKNAKQLERDKRQKRNSYHQGKRTKGKNPFFRRARRNIETSGTDFDGD